MFLLSSMQYLNNETVRFSLTVLIIGTIVEIKHGHWPTLLSLAFGWNGTTSQHTIKLTSSTIRMLVPLSRFEGETT